MRSTPRHSALGRHATLASALVLGLAACGGGDDDDNNPPRRQRPPR